MRRKSHATDLSSEEVVKDIRRATRKRYSAEEKIRIVLDGLRGEHSIAELCRREGIAEGLYYSCVRRQVLCDSLMFSRREALARFLFEVRRLCADAAIVFV